MVRFERHNYFEFAAGPDESPRIFRTFDFLFVHRGRIDLEIGRHRLSLSQGRAILIYPQTLFNRWSAGRSLVSSQHFSFEGESSRLGPSLAKLFGLKNGFELTQRPFTKLGEWYIERALHLAAVEQTPLVYEARVAQLVLILAEWQHQLSTVLVEPGYTTEFGNLVEWLECNLEHPVTAGEMAVRVGLAPQLFQRLFKESIGSTPARFFLNMRMDAGKKLLLESDAGIKSVANAVGFPDLPHFYRSFKKHTGQTPEQFRQTHD